MKNFRTNHYHDPSYGVDLEKNSRPLAIKELVEAGKREQLLVALKQGDAAPVTVVKVGEERRLYVEAGPRYGNINFYNEKTC